MSGLLNKLMTLKQEVAQADEEYEQLLADECMDVFGIQTIGGKRINEKD